MNTRTLGILAMIGAPFLCIDTIAGGFSPYTYSSQQGLLGLIYASGWICSLIGLYRLNAFGQSKRAGLVFYMQLTFTVLADGWCLYELIDLNAHTWLFHLLDICWPLSNLFMLVTGIWIVKAGGLKGWKRFTPLFVGLWLPLSAVTILLFTRMPIVLLWGTFYSALAWTFMGLSVFLTGRQDSKAGTCQMQFQ